ncbi:MAG: response regulator [Anaerolineales bacterium]|nr:response regulator [Anaerolineales bacterium]
MAKVLIVEDMPDSAEIAAQILRRYGHEVLHAASAEQGFAMAGQHGPDLILYDYWLPDMDARTFLQRLRAEPQFARTRVVVCTAMPQGAMQQSLGDLRFDACIPKPYRLSTFMRIIEEQLADPAAPGSA